MDSDFQLDFIPSHSLLIYFVLLSASLAHHINLPTH